MTIYRAEVYLPTGVTQLSTVLVSTDGATGPWYSATLPAPAPLVGGSATGALALWAAACHAIYPAVLFAFTWSDTTGKVTLAADAACWLKFSDSQADLLGFSELVHALEDGATSDEVPLGAAVLRGLSASVAQPRAASDLYEYRGGRAASLHTRRETRHAVEAVVDEAALAVLEGGPLLRTGLHLLTLGDPAVAYDPAAGVWDGQLAVTPVAESLRIDQLEGQEAQTILTFEAVAGRAP